MLKLPRFKAAAVQASPVYLNAGATAEKAASLVREAVAHGAKLVAFPEVFVPGYPYWNWITDPVTGSAWFEKLAKVSVLVPGPEVDIVRKAARDSGCFLSHLVRIALKDSVGCCNSSATSSRESSRSSLADSSRIFATSDVDTDSPRPSERTCLERSRKSRRVSVIRIDRVCCCGLRSIALIMA